MSSTVERMTLQELLRAYGITTIRDFAGRMGFSRQQAWDLWHARVGVGTAMMKRLHEELKIPLDQLIQLDPVEWKKRPKRSDKPPAPKPPPKRGRPKGGRS